MRKVVLDTSFILTCARQKIDFLHELDLLGMQSIVPEGVMREIDGLSKKPEAKLAKVILEKNRRKFWVENLRGKTVDSSIINYAREHPKVMVATLDREIKAKTKNPKIVIRQKKIVEII